MAVKNYVLYEFRIFKRKQMSTYTYKDLFIDPYLLLFSRFSSLSHIVKKLFKKLSRSCCINRLHIFSQISGVHINVVLNFNKAVRDFMCEQRVSMIRYFVNAMLIIIENFKNNIDVIACYSLSNLFDIVSIAA